MRGHDGKLPNYDDMDVRELTHHLYLVTNDLIDTIDEKIIVDKTAEGAKVNGYFESGAGTEKGRDMDARRSALPSTLTAIELDATIRMLTEEKFLIIRCIDLKLAGV